ncbi:MAG: hypothetical protein ACI4I7_00465 [Oscillospiraceae bacterium]
MKKAVKTFIILILLSLISVPLISASAFDSSQYKTNDAIYDEDEFSEVEQAIISNSELSKNKIISNLKSANEEQFTNPYKLYSISDPDFLSEISDPTFAEQIIKTDYCWMVPTKDNNIIKVKKSNGQWEVLGYSITADSSDEVDFIRFEKIDSNITTLTKSNKNELQNAICFEAPYYHTSFIYLSANGTQYLIPYGSRPDLTGLNNGKLYTTDEVEKILNSTLPTEKSSITADENGGLSSAEKGISDRTQILIFSACIFIVLILSIMTILYFKKRRNKSR